jgi:hydroxymethylbilane synthase
LVSTVNEIRIATRRSALALAQARRVADLLTDRHPQVAVQLVEVDTQGDRDKTGDITTLTDVGAFVTAVQEAVLADRADLAVHSLKDLPVSGGPPRLTIAAFPERVSPLDVLVGKNLDELAPGARVGTGSPRRAAQLNRLRPDVDTVSLRGNVDTRVRRVADGGVDAAVLAEAGLARLGLSDRISHRFTIDEMVPAPGQGALAVEAEAGSEAAEMASTLDDPALRTLVTAERELLEQTSAGCRSALGALASSTGHRFQMDLFVADERGPRRATVDCDDRDRLVLACREELGL